MLRVNRLLGLLILSAVVLPNVARTARADVRLPRIFSERAVLQRDQPIPIWGFAAPGEQVKVKLADAEATTLADDGGRWRVTLPALPAGGPHTLTVAGKNTVTVQDLLVGEVWVCIGQSNMQFELGRTQFGGRDLPNSADPKLRVTGGLVVSSQPQEDFNYNWSAASPGALNKFPAVAYYFGKMLREKLDVPVGIIANTAGAIPIESFTPAIGCEMVPSQGKIARQAAQMATEYRKMREKALETWIAQAHQAIEVDHPLPAFPPVNELIVQRGWAPTGLYNGCLHPLAPYGIRGFVMYQGEANNGQGMEYLEKMQALVGGLRKVWGQGDFPFLYVQLAPWARYPDGNLEGIWEAQRAALTAIPNTGMAVTTDLVPDLNDIHPNQKMQVGQRLALWALARTYGQKDLVYSGPLFKSATVEGDKIRVRFDHIGSGLTTRNDKAPDWFQVGTAADGFVDAEATIDGDSVVVHASPVQHPEFVRFGWKNNAQPNLVNKEGLPASPFRSDCPGVTFSTGNKFARHKKVEIISEPVAGVVRYTLDGSQPTAQSPAYSGSIDIDHTTTVAARFFAADGRSSVTNKATYTKVDPVAVDGKTLAPGVDYEFFVGRWLNMPEFNTLEVDTRGTIDDLKLINFPESYMSAHRVRGYLDIPTTGDYVFSTKAQGGVRVYLDNKLVVDDEGFHGPVEKAGDKVTLSAGKHPLLIHYHEGNAAPNLTLFYEGPGVSKQEVPATAYFHEE